jgi:hypothetical protein
MATLDVIPMPAHDRDVDQLLQIEQPCPKPVVDVMVVVGNIVGRRSDLSFQRRPAVEL